MSGDVINLRRARKAKARTERETEADINRAKYGRTKSEKAASAAETARAAKALDSHKRDA